MARIPRMHWSPRLPEYQTVGRFKRIADICSCWKKETNSPKTVQLVGEVVILSWVLRKCVQCQSHSAEKNLKFFLLWGDLTDKLQRPRWRSSSRSSWLAQTFFFCFLPGFFGKFAEKKKVMKEPKVLCIAKCFRQEFLKTDLIELRFRDTSEMMMMSLVNRKNNNNQTRMYLIFSSHLFFFTKSTTNN